MRTSVHGKKFCNTLVPRPHDFGTAAHRKCRAATPSCQMSEPWLEPGKTPFRARGCPDKVPELMMGTYPDSKWRFTQFQP